MITPIALADLSATAKGVARPEDVLTTPDGRVFVSDAGAIVSEILPDGTLRRIGVATGGEPNGMSLLPDGEHVVVADFAQGVLRRVDLATGDAEVVLSEVEARPLGAVNYPLVDLAGALWVSSSPRRIPPRRSRRASPTGSLPASTPTARRRSSSTGSRGRTA